MIETNTDEAVPKDLRTLELPEPLNRVVTGLCDLKLDMDRYSRGFIGQPFLDDWMGSRNTCAYCGDCLLHLILPFMAWENSSDSYFKAYVNPRYVLGASIKGLPEHIAPEMVDDKIARYANNFGSIDNACYIWVRPLGIFWAIEGKHRVAFMRAHNQSAIAAWVREASYPAADRITLIRPTDEHDEWLALLDGRYLQVLRRPQTTRVLLEAYGVKTLQWSEIPNALDEGTVREAIYRQKLHLSPRSTDEKERTLDFEVLRTREQNDSCIVSRTMMELKPYCFGWRRFLTSLVGSFGLGTVLFILGNEWGWVRSAGFLILGVSLGLFLSLNVIRFFGPKVPKTIRSRTNFWLS